MTGEIAAAADIATGGLIARSFEPRAGEAAHHRSHGLCLNCGTALIGDYCHVCGQAEHVHRTLGSIGHDLLHGVFHFEGKIWRTVPMLVLHPGALTRRYITGERARFVSPLALFLFSVFLMFASIHSFGGELNGSIMPAAARKQALQNIDADIARTRTQLATAEAAPRRAGSKSANAETVALRSALRELQSARGQISGTEKGDSDAIFTELKTNWPALDHGIEKANKNPGLMLYKLQSSAYKYSWVLIPISTPFVALLFLWRRRYKMYDHAIFVTYSLAFMMGLVVFVSLIQAIGAPEALSGLLMTIAPPVHMFAQLRGAYGLRKRSAVWRTIALLVFAMLALVAFVLLLLAMGLMG